MNILYINHYAGSSRHGMEDRQFHLAREWVKLGHRVTIAAASFAHVRARPPLITGQVTEEHIEGVRYVWLKTPPYRGNGVGRTLNMMAFVGQLLRYPARVMGSHAPDVVIASSTYPLDVIPAQRMAQRCGAMLVFEENDLWPLTLVELGGVSPRHPLVVLLQWAEDYAFRKAALAVSTLPKADQHMHERGLPMGRFAHIRTGTDVEGWLNSRDPVPQAHQQALEEAANGGRFMLGYAGAHGVANALDSLLEAAELLREQPVAIVLVGQGPEKERLEKFALQRGLGHVAFLPLVPKPAVPALLSRMDALYIGWHRQPLYRYGISPNKLMDYMMAAKPIVHAVDAGNDPVAEAGCGISVPAESPGAIAEAVCHLARMTPMEREAMGARGRAHVLAAHDYRVVARRFLGILSSLTAAELSECAT